jgi:hypothetical protein
MRHRILYLMCLLICVAVLMTSGHAQQSHWAAPDDKTAQFMIDMERKWAEGVCTNNGVVAELLADDFQGTSTGGQRYTKADELRDEKVHTRRTTVHSTMPRCASSAKRWQSFTAASTPSAKTKPIPTRSSARSGRIPG